MSPVCGLTEPVWDLWTRPRDPGGTSHDLEMTSKGKNEYQVTSTFLPWHLDG